MSRLALLLLFLQGRYRLFLLFCQEYQISGTEEKCVIRWTRQELSDCSGLSTRTVNRLVGSMQEEGYIEYYRGRISISREQYERMQEHLDGIAFE